MCGTADAREATADNAASAKNFITGTDFDRLPTKMTYPKVGGLHDPIYNRVAWRTADRLISPVGTRPIL